MVAGCYEISHTGKTHSARMYVNVLHPKEEEEAITFFTCQLGRELSRVAKMVLKLYLVSVSLVVRPDPGLNGLYVHMAECVQRCGVPVQHSTWFTHVHVHDVCISKKL